MLRGEILTALAVFGHDLTLNEANRRFLVFLDDRNTPLLPPDLRQVCKRSIARLLALLHFTIPTEVYYELWLQAAYVAVMQRVTTTNRVGYESLLRVYRETDLSQEKTRVLSNNISLSKSMQNI
jgi:puromycin-sensitive aminopeptidase